VSHDVEGLLRHSRHAVVHPNKQIAMFGRFHLSPPPQIQDSFESVVDDSLILAIAGFICAPEKYRGLRAVVTFWHLLLMGQNQNVPNGCEVMKKSMALSSTW
jgi:hypothetical protein